MVQASLPLIKPPVQARHQYHWRTLGDSKEWQLGLVAGVQALVDRALGQEHEDVSSMSKLKCGCSPFQEAMLMLAPPARLDGRLERLPQPYSSSVPREGQADQWGWTSLLAGLARVAHWHRDQAD